MKVVLVLQSAEVQPWFLDLWLPCCNLHHHSFVKNYNQPDILDHFSKVLAKHTLLWKLPVIDCNGRSLLLYKFVYNSYFLKAREVTSVSPPWCVHLCSQQILTSCYCIVSLLPLFSRDVGFAGCSIDTTPCMFVILEKWDWWFGSISSVVTMALGCTSQIGMSTTFETILWCFNKLILPSVSRFWSILVV